MNERFFMKLFQIPLRIYKYIEKTRFMKGFQHFGRSSGASVDCCFVGKANIRVGENCYFGKGCEVFAYTSHFATPLHSNLVIGDNVRITARCRITCAGNMTIGNNVLIASEVMITDHNHGMNPLNEHGYSPQPIIVKNVQVEDGVWLGHRVCVLPGVTIGAHSIIGANSVVTHDIPSYSVAVGSPAKVVKQWNWEEGIWENVKYQV